MRLIEDLPFLHFHRYLRLFFQDAGFFVSPMRIGTPMSDLEGIHSASLHVIAHPSFLPARKLCPCPWWIFYGWSWCWRHEGFLFPPLVFQCWLVWFAWHACTGSGLSLFDLLRSPTSVGKAGPCPDKRLPACANKVDFVSKLVCQVQRCCPIKWTLWKHRCGLRQRSLSSWSRTQKVSWLQWAWCQLTTLLKHIAGGLQCLHISGSIFWLPCWNVWLSRGFKMISVIDKHYQC